MFASGSLDGTIVVWNAETFSPVQSFNCVDDYQGDDRMYRYSIQHMTAVEGVGPTDRLLRYIKNTPLPLLK